MSKELTQVIAFEEKLYKSLESLGSREFEIIEAFLALCDREDLYVRNYIKEIAQTHSVINNLAGRFGKIVRILNDLSNKIISGSKEIEVLQKSTDTELGKLERVVSGQMNKIKNDTEGRRKNMTTEIESQNREIQREKKELQKKNAELTKENQKLHNIGDLKKKEKQQKKIIKLQEYISTLDNSIVYRESLLQGLITEGEKITPSYQEELERLKQEFEVRKKKITEKLTNFSNEFLSFKKEQYRRVLKLLKDPLTPLDQEELKMELVTKRKKFTDRLFE